MGAFSLSLLRLLLTAVFVLAAACTRSADDEARPAPVPEEARAAFSRAREFFAVEKAPEAIAEVERAVELAPDWAEARLALGKLLVTYSNVRFSTATIDRGRLDRAILELQRACELDPGNADGAFWAGFALLKADRTAEAVERLEAAVALDPRHGLALKNLGLLFAAEGEPKRSMEYLDKAREQLPRDDEILFQMGMQLESEERLEEARDVLLAAAELNPGHPGPRSRLIWIYRRLGDEQASDFMSQEFERCRAFGKRMTQASQHFDENSQDPAACMGLAELYRDIGMHEPAIQWAERALRLEEKYEPATELLRALGKPIDKPAREDGVEALERLIAPEDSSPAKE